MSGASDSGSFFVKFRQRRDEKRRIEALRARAESLKDGASPNVVERVIGDLDSRALKIEEIERQELKAFVQGLKDLREELLRAERELEELDFRRLIGELDAVEVQIRKESLSLRVRDLKRTLEQDLEEYKALRAFIESVEQAGSAPAVSPEAAGASVESTLMFDPFKLKRSPSVAAPADSIPSVGPEPVKVPMPTDQPPKEAAAGSPVSAPGGEAAPAASMPTVQPPAAFPPLVVDEAGLESVVIDHDFVPQVEAAACAEPPAGFEGMDDLSQLDALSKSLEEISAKPAPAPAQGPAAELRPMPIASPQPEVPAPGAASSPFLDGEEAQEDATIVRRTPTDSQTVMVAQPMLLLKGQDGTERSTFVLRPGVSTIGRGLDNEVVLDDRAISRKHATVAYEMDGSFRITDLGSENGTYVNGVRITSQLLKDGDEIHMGKSTLIFSHGK